MRKRFEVSEEQLQQILGCCKPVPYLVFGGIPPRSPQENANAAWSELGRTMGFDYMTVKPTGEGDRFFTAEVTQKHEQPAQAS
jgi:predicted TIM-barrel fold metal-dependent hydrolase